MSAPYYGEAVEDPPGSGLCKYYLHDGTTALCDGDEFERKFGFHPGQVYKHLISIADTPFVRAVIHMQQVDHKPASSPAILKTGGGSRAATPSAVATVGTPLSSSVYRGYAGLGGSVASANGTGVVPFASSADGNGKMAGKRKSAPSDNSDPHAFDVGDVLSVMPPVDFKLVQSEKGGISYLEALAQRFPSGHADPITGKMAPAYNAIVAAMAIQPGLKVHAPAPVSRALAVASGDPRTHLYDELSCWESLDYQAMQAPNVCERDHCACGACTRIVHLARQSAPMRNRHELVQSRTDLMNRLRNPAAAHKDYNLRNRFRGVFQQGTNTSTATFVSVSNHMKQLCEATQDLVMSFGAQQNDPAAKSTIAHLGNILNAQQQVLDYLLLQSLPAGNTTKQYLVGRETFAYHNFVSTRPAEIAPSGGSELVTLGDLTAGVARGRYPPGT
jgi:hypothetical protein